MIWSDIIYKHKKTRKYKIIIEFGITTNFDMIKLTPGFLGRYTYLFKFVQEIYKIPNLK